MHRMRRFCVLFGLAALLTLGTWDSARASTVGTGLLKPNAGRAYPDISADINGTVNYTYDPSSETGLFHVKNTPYSIAGGENREMVKSIRTIPGTGIRTQELKLTLDSDGQLVTSGTNSYELHGAVIANGVTYSGLLLKGTPTAFGAQDLGAAGIQGTDFFDVEMDITGGELASFFGRDAYIRIAPELNSTFTGKFDEDFSAEKAISNTRGYNSPRPFPVPEPTTLTLLVVGLGGAAWRGRRRLAAR